MIRIHQEIYAIETALYLKNEEAIVIADPHFGFEESLHRQGVLVPKRQYKLMMEQLKRITSIVKAKKIVLNGDVKHEFGKITKQEWKDINNLLDFCEDNFKETIIIKGNHDPILKFLVDKRNIKEAKEYNLSGVLMAHGDHIPEKLSRIILIGHEHPAITLRHEAKSEKYKCFLKGKFRKSILIVQPSFNPLVEGSDVTKEKEFGPFLKEGLKDPEVFVYDDVTKEVLYFGALKML